MKKNIIITILSILLSISIIVIIITNIGYKDEINKLEEDLNQSKETNSVYKEAIENMTSSNDDNYTSKENEYSNIIQINYDTYDKMVSQKQDFILIATQTYCSHCHDYKPILNEVLQDNNLIAYEIDLLTISDEEKSLFKDQTNVTGTPTTLFYKNGELNSENRLVGSASEDTLTEKLKELDYIR